MLQLTRRQGYGAVTDGLSQAGNAISGSASRATHSLSKPQIIGIAVAIIVLFAILIGLTWYGCVRHARKRDSRNEAERQEIQQREQRANSDVRITVPHQQQPITTRQEWLAAQRRGSEPATDEDYWKNEPLAPVDGYAHQPQQQYVVEFDHFGRPQYHPPQPAVATLPAYGEAVSPTSTPYAERQPMYRHH